MNLKNDLFIILTFYKILHFSDGFMGDPVGHRKALANSLEFDKVPNTRILPGLWTSVNKSFNNVCSVVDSHHICKFLIKF